MSYRHPRFYREDFTGFNRAMQQSFNKQFTNVMDYYDEKIAERKQYETDLYAQADKMREEAEAAGNIGSKFQEELEAEIQTFLKEGLKVEATGKRGGIGLFGSKIQETGKKDKLDLDKANANFKAKITAANGITDRAFIQDLEIDEDYDHGSGSYLEYASVIKGLKSNFREGGSINFKYEGDNNFAMGITINNPRYDDELPVNDNKFLADGKTINPDYNPKQLTYNAQEIQRLIGENDPEARKRLEERIETTEETLLNQAKSDLEKRNAYGQSVKGTEGNMQGRAYYGETDVKNRVEQFVTELQQQDENNPDDGSIIDDIFNNKVKFNDAIRLEELQNVNDEGTKLLMDKVKDPKLADELAMLLDLPKNDLHYQNSILRKMGITDPEEVKKVRSSLNEAKNNMVKRYLVNTVVGAGIGSKFVSPTQPKDPSGPRSGSGANQDAKLYSQKKFGEATRALGGTAVVGIEDPDFVGPKVATLANTNKNYYDTAEAEKAEIESIFNNMEIDTKDGIRQADGVNFDPLTKKLTFDFTAKTNVSFKDSEGNDAIGDLPGVTNSYDMSDPDQFEKLYLTMGIKATGQKGMSYETDYSRMASIYGKQNFFTHLYDQGRVVNPGTLGDGNMSKWVTKTIKEDPQFVFDSLENLTDDQFADIKDKLIILPGTTQPITIEKFMLNASVLKN